MSVVVGRIAENLERVRGRMAEAARRAGRDPSTVRLCVVTKGRDVAAVREAVAGGASLLGENRVQEAGPKIEVLADLRGTVSWHLIGHLQRNKARRAVGIFDLVQSVDSVELARRLSDLGMERGRPIPVFVEVHTSSEPTKTGLPLEGAEDAIARIREMTGIALEGLMTMAPFTQDEARIRGSFGTLRGLGERGGTRELSMGMSSDFELAIEEGATIVRVGSAIFE